MDPITAAIMIFGSLFASGLNAQGQASAARDNRSAKEKELDFARESRDMEYEAQDEENRRRQTEAAFRAAKLEDVAAMFEGLGGPGGDMDMLRNLGNQLLSQDSGADLRQQAMRGLDRDGGMLNAMLAQSGVMGSGFGAEQQRGLAGDVISNLAQAMASNRQQNIMGAGQMFGQAGGLDLSRIGSIGNLFQDDAFGPNAPMPKRRSY